MPVARVALARVGRLDVCARAGGVGDREEGGAAVPEASVWLVRAMSTWGVGR